MHQTKIAGCSEIVEDRLLTDSDVADIAQVSIYTVRYWRQIGILPFVKVGRHPRIWLSEIYRIFKKPGVKHQ